LNYGVDLTQAVKLGANGVQIDNNELQALINSGKVSEDDATEWIDKLTDQYKTSEDQLKGLRETLDNIEELEAEGKEAFYDLRDMAKEAILSSLQKQIDIQE
jgi:polyhydroxyalkanoate synthesis regulator phasin